jgi:hypothetical protein
MFVRHILFAQVIKLFTDEPKYRDDRWATVERIILQHYEFEFGRSILASCKLAYDIDRAFRYVQQHVPELRGRTWMKRQWQAGEISRAEYEENGEVEQAFRKVCEQMHINFEP